MDIDLHYGDHKITLQIPSENLARFIEPLHQSQQGDNSTFLQQAISPRAIELIELTKDKTIALLLPDGTRDLAIEDALAVMLPYLKNARKHLFFICTGTHNGQTPENQKIIDAINIQSQTSGIENIEIIVHDCRQSEFNDAGITTRKTPVLYNHRLDDADMFFAFSDIKHHYFAGYSNPIKNFVPGLCAFQTTQQNHSWTMDSRSAAGVHPWHPDNTKHDNPLAADQLEAMQMIVKDCPVWALTTISTEKQIQHAAFGPAQAVTTETIHQVDTWNTHAVKPVDYMIVSPGGLPNDVDLYIAQRALELTTSVLRDKGQLLFLAACPNGVGAKRTDEQFHNPLKMPLETICQNSQADYKLFSHKPIRFARLIQRLKHVYMTSDITPAEIEKIHMIPCAAPQQLIESWIQKDSNAEILVVDGANKLSLNIAE